MDHSLLLALGMSQYKILSTRLSWSKEFMMTTLLQYIDKHFLKKAQTVQIHFLLHKVLSLFWQINNKENASVGWLRESLPFYGGVHQR